MRKFDFWDLILNVTPIPSLKTALFSTSSIETGGSWSEITTRLCRNIAYNTSDNYCFGAKLFVRGVQDDTFWSVYPKLQTRIQQKIGCMSLLPINAVESFYYGLDARSSKKSLDCIYNSSSIVEILEPIYAKSKLMYENRAYLHWYEQYAQENTSGLFEESFENVHQILDSYTRI